MRGITLGYVVRRLGMLLLTVWLGATLIFSIPRLAPGDPIAAMVSRMQQQAGNVEGSAEMIEAWRARFGLDAPFYLQYLRFLRNIVRGDLSYSLFSFPSKVEDLVARSLPWTVGLLTLATIFSFVIGNLIGALLAWRRTPGLVKTLLPLSFTFTSIPFFMLGILLIYIFGFGLDWFPVAGALRPWAGPRLELGLHKKCDSPWNLAGLGHRDCIHGFLGHGHARHDDYHRRRGLHDPGSSQRPATLPHLLALWYPQFHPAAGDGAGSQFGGHCRWLCAR